jgi:hypothetical protein
MAAINPYFPNGANAVGGKQKIKNKTKQKTKQTKTKKRII